MSWAFEKLAKVPWVVQVHRPLSGGAAGAGVLRRVAQLRRQAAERRRGERQSGTAKTRAAERNGVVPWLPVCPARGRCALLAPGDLASGTRSGPRRWPSKYYLGHLCAGAREHEIVDIPPF